MDILAFGARSVGRTINSITSKLINKASRTMVRRNTYVNKYYMVSTDTLVYFLYI